MIFDLLSMQGQAVKFLENFKRVTGANKKVEDTVKKNLKRRMSIMTQRKRDNSSSRSRWDSPLLSPRSFKNSKNSSPRFKPVQSPRKTMASPSARLKRR